MQYAVTEFFVGTQNILQNCPKPTCPFKIKVMLFCNHCSSANQGESSHKCFMVGSWMTLSTCQLWVMECQNLFNIIFTNFHKHSHFCCIYCCWFKVLKYFTASGHSVLQMPFLIETVSLSRASPRLTITSFIL